ncbi:hypothetical protein Aca07nite_38890 [Actinoplanes capillaceus]|uniref:Uncharacterized protein n=2 Tax=Actinoplanes campanulatus TaxID=113559 RepID=A0ABQ3WK38_9ACTN|nr:hypothetical protein Aca07nite_38890 [Actinoplanes capillaceus]
MILIMEITGAPRLVRLSSILLGVLALTGLFLVIVAVVELRWWGTSAPEKLTAIFADIADQDGPRPPLMLRGHGGAIELLVMGVVGVACGVLAPLVLRGRRWARTTILVTTSALALWGMLSVGADGGALTGFPAYFDELAGDGFAARVPEIDALLYPDWYSWAEDIAQGLLLIMSLTCLVALAWAVIRHGDYFTTKRVDQAGPDVWQETLSRIHQKGTGR